jgi:transcriptional regulator with XRE-family HTH domain
MARCLEDDRKVDPKSMRYRNLLIKNHISNSKVCKAIGIRHETGTNLLSGKYSYVDIKILVLIANYFKVTINEIYDTGSHADEKNTLKLKILDNILKDKKILIKLRKIFSRNECIFLTEMLKAEVYNNPSMPKHFLVSIILEADYYSNLSLIHKIRSQDLADKIDDLNELEAFTLLNYLLEYNYKEEDNIDRLFYTEEVKNAKRKKSVHL